MYLVVAFLSILSLTIIFDVARSEFWDQLIAIAMGFIFSLLIANINYKYLKASSFSLYLFAIIILIAVLLLGQEIHGAKSWFGWRGLGFQPVELVKLIVVILLAKYFSLHYREILLFRHALISLVFIMPLIFLIFLQPDLGSLLVLAMIWLIMLIVVGLRFRYFILLSLSAFFLSLSGWLWFLKDYQKERLKVFINPQLDPLGRGYNVIQSIIAIGSGGFWGRGLGYGLQSQLNFLPEKHTDFIFAVIAEELGFWGVLLVLAFYGFIFFRAYHLAKETRDNFGKFIVIGIMVFFLTHIIINIGMNLGLFPVIGVPLLFLSYGGSSIVSAFIALGLLQSVKKHSTMLE